MLKKPLPKNDFKKRKYFLMILKLKSEPKSINPKSLDKREVTSKIMENMQGRISVQQVL